jgi:hypothetical protein
MQVLNDSIGFVSPLLLNKFIRLLQQGINSSRIEYFFVLKGRGKRLASPIYIR